MSIVYVEDRGGKTIKLHQYKGQLYPTFKQVSLKNATEIEARADDLLLIAYPKSGTHWLNEITRFLLAGTTEIPISEKREFMLEQADPNHINGLPFDARRNLNSHCRADTLSPDFLLKGSKIIYVTRDPRDVATSFYNHHSRLKGYEYQGEWDDYFPTFVEGKLDYGSWFEHTKGWEKCIKDNPDHPFLTLTYEELKRNPFDNAKRLSNFIGTNCSDELLRDIVSKTTFESMATNRQDPVMYRKGIVGDWKNVFTVAQSEMFDEIFEKEMAGTYVYKIYAHRPQ